MYFAFNTYQHPYPINKAPSVLEIWFLVWRLVTLYGLKLNRRGQRNQIMSSRFRVGFVLRKRWLCQSHPRQWHLRKRRFRETSKKPVAGQSVHRDGRRMEKTSKKKKIVETESVIFINDARFRKSGITAEACVSVCVQTTVWR